MLVKFAFDLQVYRCNFTTGLQLKIVGNVRPGTILAMCVRASDMNHEKSWISNQGWQPHQLTFKIFSCLYITLYIIKIVKNKNLRIISILLVNIIILQYSAKLVKHSQIQYPS